MRGLGAQRPKTLYPERTGGESQPAHPNARTPVSAHTFCLPLGEGRVTSLVQFQATCSGISATSTVSSCAAPNLPSQICNLQSH